MSNITNVINVRIDTDKFENSNDLTKDVFSKYGTKTGEFTISDGTEYTYTFNYDLTINKKSSFVEVC